LSLVSSHPHNPLPDCFSEFDQAGAERVLKTTLQHCDDGEIFLENRESEAVVFDDGRLKSASYSADKGFGLRVVNGETTGYAHAADFSLAALKRASEAVSLARQADHQSQSHNVGVPHTNRQSPYQVIDTVGD